MNTVRSLVDAQAGTRPDATYFVATETGRSLTFDALRESCEDFSDFLAARGLPPGAHVSFVMPNGIATLRMLLGAMYGGYCVNPVNLLSSAEQMRYVLDHSDCAMAFASPEWAAKVREIVKDIARPIEVVEVDPDESASPRALASSPPAPHAASSSPAPHAASSSRAPQRGDGPGSNSLALLMYTSGTTGTPKGVMLTQSNLVANARTISAEHALGPGDRVLAVLPLYHINAFAVTMLSPLAHGGSLAMPPKFSAGRFWDLASRFECTWINVVPTIVSYLLEGEAPPRASIARIRFCRSASAPLPPEHLLAFQSKFGISVIETMGLTETVAPAFSNPLDAAGRKVGSVGRASGCEARVVDEKGDERPDGEPGEIVIRGPQVMPGYYKNEAATAGAFFPGGWLRTGDVGVRDRDGFFFVTGRIKELIIKGGENIAPREIDEVLLRHPAVLDAAAVGVPDKHYGQDVAACVILREGATCGEDELKAFCVERLGKYKAPRSIRFVAELPRGPSGKVQRLKLAAQMEVR